VPTISVVIPAFNAAAWIDETLEAVIAQTDPAEEIVVVDDGSTDDTRLRVQAFGDRVRLIAQDNAGCGMAFNAGISAAVGEFVALCPADDLWVPHKLEYQRATLRSHPEVDVSFSAAEDFGLRNGPFPRPARTGIQDAAELLDEMFERNVVPDPSVVVRRALLQRLGGFIADVGEDYEFWMRALRNGAVFHFDDRVLVRLRQHGGNLSAMAAEIWRMNLRVHRDAAPDIADRDRVSRVLARDLARLGRCEAGLGNAGAARAAFRESLRQRPSATAAAGALALSLPGSAHALGALHRRRAGQPGPA
jgi:glycosyltransferase involved in cell wall biosynthesis